MLAIEGFLRFLWLNVLKSYKSTLLGLLVALIGEALVYFANSTNPYVHLLVALAMAPFIAWRDNAQRQGTIKLLVLFLAFAPMAYAQPVATFDQSKFDQPHTGTLADVAPSDPPPSPAPTRPQLGGCFTPKLCIGPEVALNLSAINLSTRKVEFAFQAGLGLGLTYGVPGSWKTVGVAFYLNVDQGANNLYLAGTVSALNYIKAGVSKGFLNDQSWRVLLPGPGISF